ncbi:DUF5711 family protein [Lachnobacterium bovis]|uniref:Uncharacterized protein n=1 Tax=Lachnobacterium bovis TaxID=140626 RepID=A0A1H9URC9_9FIRM|nr:DUF5711 family protein [Lachnobacterium bovis]SES11952.1 hypothetical protein SAMN02910429_02229 [Lachnobacterium bovis]
MAIKSEFKRIETNEDIIEKKVREHKKKIFRRIVVIALIVISCLILFELISSMRSYSRYTVVDYSKCSDTGASKYESFKGNIVEYTNDGANYKNTSGDLIWNQAYTMTTPVVAKCNNYFVIYDKGGTKMVLLNENGIVENIETTKPIQKAKVADQGSIATIQKSGTEYTVKLYDKRGKELAGGEYHGNKGGFPIDVAISSDSKKMAVSLIDINKGKVDTTLNFYNFDTVGQNKIDNNVGSYAYEDTIIPEIYYASNNLMVGVSDNAIYQFAESDTPKLKRKIKIKDNIRSVFYNDKYVGVVTEKSDEKNEKKHIIVYDKSGKIAMENHTKLAYDTVELLDNNEICVKNNSECEIYTMYSIRKLKTKFEQEIYKIFPRGSSRKYLFIGKGEMQEVKLY